MNQPAELSASYELSLSTQPLEVANVHGFNEDEATLLSQLEQALRLLRILRQRLLAEHMFARFDARPPPFVMEGGRKRDIHGIYVFGLQQRLVGAEAALNSMACSKLFGLLPRSRGDCGHFDALRFLGRPRSPYGTTLAVPNTPMRTTLLPSARTVPDARSSLAYLQAKNAYVSAATLSIHYQYVVDRRAPLPRFMPIRFGAIANSEPICSHCLLATSRGASVRGKATRNVADCALLQVERERLGA